MECARHLRAWREACAFWALPVRHWDPMSFSERSSVPARRRSRRCCWCRRDRRQPVGCHHRCADAAGARYGADQCHAEIMAGDLISGLNRTAEAILVATAIALGTVLPLVIGQVHNDGMRQPAPGRPACGPVLPVWASDRYSTSMAGAFGSVASARHWAGWRIWRPSH